MTSVDMPCLEPNGCCSVCMNRLKGKAWIPLTILFAGVVMCAALPGVAYLKPPPSPPASHTNSSSSAVTLMIVGDWGRDGNENQKVCAAGMAAVAESLRAEAGNVTGVGQGVHAVISTGDNFYPDGIPTLRNVSAFQKSFTEVYDAVSIADLTWHTVMGNHDYHGDVEAQVSETLAKEAMVGQKSRWDAMRGGYREFDAAGNVSVSVGAGTGKEGAVLGVCFIDTNPWVHHYREKPNKYNFSGVKVVGESWKTWEAAELAALEKCLRESKATWRIVVGHHPIVSYGSHGSQPELAEVREIIERMGAAVYFNGHDHNLQHLVPNTRAAVPGTPAPQAVHFVTTGAGSNLRDDVDTSKKDLVTPGDGAGPLKFSHAATPGFVVLRASRSSLRITFHGGSAGALLHTGVISKDTV